MNELEKGLKFAIEHEMSQKEMELFLIFMDNPTSTTEIAREMGAKMTTIHSIVSRLKLKGLIKLINNSGQYKIYGVNL